MLVSDHKSLADAVQYMQRYADDILPRLSRYEVWYVAYPGWEPLHPNPVILFYSGPSLYRGIWQEFLFDGATPLTDANQVLVRSHQGRPF